VAEEQNEEWRIQAKQTREEEGNNREKTARLPGKVIMEVVKRNRQSKVMAQSQAQAGRIGSPTQQTHISTAV
jgi:hypothetical protein